MFKKFIQKLLYGAPVTKYRIIETLDYCEKRALQFQHADGSWRCIPIDAVCLIDEDATQNNAPRSRNGFGMTIGSWSASALDLKWFAFTHPDIGKYFERLQKSQHDYRAEQAKRIERREQATEYL